MAEAGECSSRPAARDGGTDEPASIPRGLNCAIQPLKKKLVLHVDLNNTILVSDSATHQGTIAALEYFLSTVTWGKMDRHGKWEWLSDSPSLLPPCEGAINYYSQFGAATRFTSTAGKRFRGILEDHLRLLSWPEDKKDTELSCKGEDGQLYHKILPSFFQLLTDLVQDGIEFALLFRTFGHDLPYVLGAVSRALTQGAHPLFPDLPDLKLSVNTTAGKIRCSTKEVVLSRGNERASSRDGERGLYQYLSSVQGLGGFQDHFDWWVTNNFMMRGGKPLWIDPFDEHVQHIFIDDNIRQNTKDAVIHPKVFLDPGGTATRTACVSELYDLTLIQTDLLQAISDPHYFTRRIRICQENYERNLQQVSG